MRFLVLLLLLSMSMSSLFHGTDSKESPRFLGGGYEPIKNLADPHIQDIAKFAVSEHNKMPNSKLIYQRIMYGEQQLVEGMNYVLIIEAKVDGTRLSRYEAYVSESLKQNMQLTSFTPFVNNNKLMAQRFIGGYEPIENLTDPNIQDIAKFAVLSEQNLIYQRIMYGEHQLVNGMNYVLIIEAKDGARLSRYEAYLFESLGRTQLKLNSLMPFVKNPPPVSAWKPVENLEKDMHILEIARNAVLEHNKKLLAKANKYHDHDLDDDVLVFEKVVSGETQETLDHDQGVKYRLVISANGAKYEALIWEKVTSFKPLP